MAFPWELAKSALKNAQKKIDKVLDIKEEQEDTYSFPAEDESLDVIVEEPTKSEALPEVPLLSPQSTKSMKDSTELTSSRSSKTETPAETSGWDNQWGQEETLPDLEVSARHEEVDVWSAWDKPTQEDQPVVDSEPNPIRDAHMPSASLYNHSPSSNSPDEAETEHTKPYTEEKEGGEETRSEAAAPPTVMVDVPLREADLNSRRGSHHEETLTVASSDIEVIRNVDAWSVASSHSMALLANGNHSRIQGNGQSDEAVVAIHAQLKHAEQRLEDLRKQNAELKDQNLNLTKKVTAANANLMAAKKDLTIKEGELKDLLNEGQRLSDHSGKQAREIRRLKAQVADFDKVKEANNALKAEKAELENVAQLRESEITNLKATIRAMKQEAESSEIVRKHAEGEEEKLRKAEELIVERDKQIEALKEELAEMETRLEATRGENFAVQLAESRAHDSISTVASQANELAAINEKLCNQLKNSEKRIEQLMMEKSELAVNLSEASGPLLNEILELKGRLDAEQLTAAEALEEALQLRKKLDVATLRVRELEQEVAKERANFHTEELRRANEITQFTKEAERLTEENSQLRKQIKESAGTARELRVEIHEVRDELNAAQQRVDDLQNQVLNLKSENSRLDVALKEQLNVESRRKDTSTPVIQIQQPAELHVAEQTARLFVDVPSSAVQSELEALSAKHSLALNRIAALEVEAARVAALQQEIFDLQRQLEELRAAYDCLLEVDGERLERIEELEHDVIDLREVLRQQMLVFGAAMEEKKAMEKQAS